MRRISWTEALTCPAVAGLVKDARSVARNERHSWYPAWLPNSAIFNAALRALAAWLNVGNLDDVRNVVLTGLLDEYHTERRNVPHVPPVHARPPSRIRRNSRGRGGWQSTAGEPSGGGRGSSRIMPGCAGRFTRQSLHRRPAAILGQVCTPVAFPENAAIEQASLTPKSRLFTPLYT